MVGRHEVDRWETGVGELGRWEWVELPPHGSHRLGGREQEVRRGEAECDNYFGIDDPDLLDEVRGAKVRFIDGRGRVVWWSGLEDIGDVD